MPPSGKAPEGPYSDAPKYSDNQTRFGVEIQAINNNISRISRAVNMKQSFTHTQKEHYEREIAQLKSQLNTIRQLVPNKRGNPASPLKSTDEKLNNLSARINGVKIVQTPPPFSSHDTSTEPARAIDPLSSELQQTQGQLHEEDRAFREYLEQEAEQTSKIATAFGQLHELMDQVRDLVTGQDPGIGTLEGNFDGVGAYVQGAQNPLSSTARRTKAGGGCRLYLLLILTFILLIVVLAIII